MITVRRLRVRSFEGHFQVTEVDESGTDGAEVARSDGSDQTSPITSFSDENGLLFRLRESHLGKALFSNETRGPADELLANVPLIPYDAGFVDYDFRVDDALAFTVESEAIPETEEAGKPGFGRTHDVGAAAITGGSGPGGVLDAFTEDDEPDSSCHLVRIHDPELDVRVALGLVVLLARTPV